MSQNWVGVSSETPSIVTVETISVLVVKKRTWVSYSAETEKQPRA